MTPTPYWTDGRRSIIHGDSTEVLPTIPDDSVEFVCTDPPYFRVVDADWDDQWGTDVGAFLEWIGGILDHARRVLVDRGTVAVFCSPDLAAGVEMEVRKRFNVLNHIVWRKPPGRLGRADKESLRRFFPTSERIILAEQNRTPDSDLWRFVDHVNHKTAETVYADIRAQLVALRDAAGYTNREVDELLGTKGMAGHYFGRSQWMLPNLPAWEVIAPAFRARGVEVPEHAELAAQVEARRPAFNAERRQFDAHRREFDTARRAFGGAAGDIELFSDVWSFPTVRGTERTEHPTQKPLPLMLHLIGTLTRPGDRILDPFGGTMTTLRAAKDLGRDAIGIEMDRKWCDVGAERLAQDVLDFDAPADAPADLGPMELFG